MTLTNHFLTGVGLAVISKNPYIALPAAIGSHYVLDILPHYGFKNWQDRENRIFNSMAIIDFGILVLLIGFLSRNNVPGWYYLSGLFGYLPDLAWIYRWSISEKFGSLTPKPANKLNMFHKRIQKYESLWGIFPEIIYGTILFLCIQGQIQ